MISLGSVGSLLKVLQSTDTQTAKTLLKLVSVDILKSLGENKYLLEVDNKQIQAKSQRELQEGERYFARFTLSKEQLPTLSHLLKVPLLAKALKPLAHTPLALDTKSLTDLLQTKHPIQTFKESFLKEIVTTTNKEHFQALSNLLISLNYSVFTLPVYFHDRFGFLQIKKRYNKKTKKVFLDFYAMFEHLGPISGVISSLDIHINVAYEETKEILLQNEEELRYDLTIDVIEQIEPLFEAKTQNILDIKT